MQTTNIQRIGFNQLVKTLVPDTGFAGATEYKTALENIINFSLPEEPKYFACTVGDIKTNAGKLGNYFGQEKVKEILAWFDKNKKSYNDNSKVILFLGCACPNTDSKTDAEEKVMCLANNGVSNILIIPGAVGEYGCLMNYLDAVFGPGGKIICGLDNTTNPMFLISGQGQHKALFKIPWKKEWGSCLPSRYDAQGFDELYKKIKQQSQTANINNNQNTQNQMIQKNTTTQAVPKITIFAEYGGVKHMISINSNKTMSDLRDKIIGIVGNQNFEVTYNATKLKMDDRQLSSVFNQNTVKLMVGANRSDLQAQPNQNFQNQIIRNNAITQGDKMINISFLYNGKMNRFQIEPHKTIRELMNQIFNMARNNNVEARYKAQNLNMNDNRQLSQIFGNSDAALLTVYDKKIGAQTQTIQNTIQPNQNIIGTGYDNGLKANGTAIVNNSPVLAPRQMVKTVPVKRLVTMRTPVVPPPRVVPKLVPAQFVRPPTVVPVPRPVQFVPPLQVVNNNPFGDRTTGYIPGLRIFQRRPAQVPPRPIVVPPPRVVPAPRPMRTPVVPKVVPVPRPMRTPVVSPPPVVPVQQGGGNRPEPDTYYVLQGYTKNMNTQVTNWSPQPTQRIPMDYQTYINQNIHGAQPFRPNWSPKYQYCDELGMIFESDSPIYKDARNNLVTLGNARYRTP